MLDKITAVANSAANLFIFLEVVTIVYLVPGAIRNKKNKR